MQCQLSSSCHVIPNIIQGVVIICYEVAETPPLEASPTIEQTKVAASGSRCLERAGSGSKSAGGQSCVCCVACAP